MTTDVRKRGVYWRSTRGRRAISPWEDTNARTNAATRTPDPAARPPANARGLRRARDGRGDAALEPREQPAGSGHQLLDRHHPAQRAPALRPGLGRLAGRYLLL